MKIQSIAGMMILTVTPAHASVVVADTDQVVDSLAMV